MKENKYDDNIFFQKYSQMSRSQQGLAGAGEWETLRKLLPDFKDKRVLDLGCGYGWHCIYAMEHGASSVVGVDISHKMLEVAKEKTHFPQVEYKCCAIEDVEFPEESFDVILSSLAFHYVADYEILVKKIYRILKSGGKLVFTVEHPVFTAYGTQDWYYNEKGEILIIAPGNSLSIFLITGPDKGEKFLVGSSKISTFAPLKLILKRSTLAFCPPDSSLIGCSISSAVYLREPRYVLILVLSSLSPDLSRKSTGVISKSSISS